jgi:hypothetical protein
VKLIFKTRHSRCAVVLLFRLGAALPRERFSPMTVDSLTTAAMGGAPMVSTTWFDQSGKQHHSAYLEAIVEADDGSPTLA